ncbi:MAG: AmmeMemoRadiSam system radical SAM enzyme [Planctomycetota bacterium]|nr:MAG: AmmeMemoRadiSam system radical SAM enzyme [Planctomycetota bacterium]
MSTSLKDLLADYTMPAAPELVRDEGDGVLRCLSCAHRCKIADGKTGVCRVRFNRGGEMRVPAGYVAGLNIDPIEKKPFFHVLPGSDALSFGMLGCNFHCSFCQNWVSSQALRDDRAIAMPDQVSAQRLLDLAVKRRTPLMVSTYNEPLITADWAVEIFKEARKQGIICGFVSNGNATPEVLEFLRPYMDLYKVDLKCYSEDNYRQLGGKLSNVLDTIGRLKQMGFWVEVVTLVVPTFNDSDEELTNIARFIAGVSVDIPWHATAFHPDYKMTGPPRTPIDTLIRAYDIGKNEGLKFVYSGNLPGYVGDRESTFCPGCNAKLVQRYGFSIKENRIADGKCPDCSTEIPGVWKINNQKS